MNAANGYLILLPELPDLSWSWEFASLKNGEIRTTKIRKKGYLELPKWKGPGGSVS